MNSAQLQLEALESKYLAVGPSIVSFGAGAAGASLFLGGLYLLQRACVPDTGETRALSNNEEC